MSLFAEVIRLNDAIEEEGKRVENLVRGMLAGNIFDLGSAQVGLFSLESLSAFQYLICLYLTDT